LPRSLVGQRKHLNQFIKKKRLPVREEEKGGRRCLKTAVGVGASEIHPVQHTLSTPEKGRLERGKKKKKE